MSHPFPQDDLPSSAPAGLLWIYRFLSFTEATDQKL
jgi:hypothetical protein